MEINFELTFLNSFNEAANIKIPNSGAKLNLRIVQNVADTSKFHSIDFKMFKTGGSSKSDSTVMLIVDPKTMRIDKDRTEAEFKGRNKERDKLYKEYVDLAGAAILYAEDELRKFFDDEKNRRLATYENIDTKMEEFGKLYTKDRDTFNKYMKLSKGKESLDEETSIKIGEQSIGEVDIL